MCVRVFLFAAQSNVTDSVLEVVAYEARRLFRDRLVSLKDVHAFDNILSSIVRGDWGSDALDNMTGGLSCSILTGRHLRQTHAYKHSFFGGFQTVSETSSKASKTIRSPQARQRQRQELQRCPWRFSFTKLMLDANEKEKRLDLQRCNDQEQVLATE